MKNLPIKFILAGIWLLCYLSLKQGLVASETSLKSLPLDASEGVVPSSTLCVSDSIFQLDRDHKPYAIVPTYTRNNVSDSKPIVQLTRKEFQHSRIAAKHLLPFVTNKFRAERKINYINHSGNITSTLGS